MNTVSIKTDELGKHFSEIQKMGLRYCGLEGEAKEKDYILNKLNDFGLDNVQAEPFQFLSYYPEDAKLEVTSPGKEIIKCKPLQFTANDTAEGEVVFAGI